ncbi:MAG: phosphodiester glycosidase family protein [Clostridiales bacterium]|jgi:hypothetical protein|nr:phosphodiester glycosidase family protein [Clostridiales bacterium]
MRKFILLLIVTTSLLLSNSLIISAEVGDVTTLITFSMTDNTEIYGLTARDSLGKATGTLEEFSSAVLDCSVINYALFPANYFDAYDDKEIIGGIYSQGRVVNDSWMNWGCGFDANNKFHLFRLPSSISNAGGKIVIQDNAGNNVEVVTAFNCYPWLIKDGLPLDISPFPGADEQFLSSSAQRAFMGQQEDGTFLYGLVRATIVELRDICVELGLVNAVNTDGGASCGVYSSGDYLAVPGRELASAVYIAERKPQITVLYNGVQIEFTQPSVEKNGYVFYPLEDVFAAFSSNGHVWDGDTFTVYGELNGNKVEIPLRAPSYVVNGLHLDIAQELLPFVENERTYVYLDYIVVGLGLTVAWDGATKTISITN